MNTISIPINEYKKLQNELILLKNQELLQKINVIIDLLYDSKYGLYMGNFTEDLAELTIDNLKEWESNGDVWDDV